jgi:hypothetical protein
MSHSIRFAVAALAVTSASYFLYACHDSAEPTAPAAAVSTAALASQGQWSGVISWPNVAVHMLMLPTGRVLAFGKATPTLWNPPVSAFKPKVSTVPVFCSGHADLPDGRVLVMGGDSINGKGLANASIYQPEPTGMWIPVAKMHYGRWYPTATTLADGTVLVNAGTDYNGKNVTIPEVWTGTGWRTLTGANRTIAMYPRSFLAPDGRVFLAGPDQPSLWLNTSGSGAYATGPSRLAVDRDYGSAVMYAPGKILYVGGGDPPTASAETIDLNAASPTWRATGSMSVARRQLNAVVLPTGDVLVLGGESGPGFNNIATAVRSAELWSPTAGTWTTLASASVPRGYHTAAVLLSDGRVLLGGSGDTHDVPNQLNAEIFSPPYLFKGTRPAITSVPTSVGYGQSFTVATAQASAIAQANLLRLGAVTHAFDQNARLVPLTFTRGAGVLTVQAPARGTVAPPGVYMLFLVDGNGVPSVAAMVRVG